MKESFARLSSLERRFVVGVMFVVFILLNAVFVWPRFSDWGRMRNRIDDAHRKLHRYEAVIAQMPTYKKLVDQMEKASAPVPPEDQSVNFSLAIQSQAAQSGVAIRSFAPLPLRTNEFFLESAANVAIQSGEPQLVDFLYKLGSGTSLTRVRGLSLRPDPPRHELGGNITLIASYQKKTTVRRAPPAATASKPATPTARKP